MSKKDEAPPAAEAAAGAIDAESPTGLERTVEVDVDKDARAVVLAIGDSKAVLDVTAASQFRLLLDRAFMEVA